MEERFNVRMENQLNEDESTMRGMIDQTEGYAEEGGMITASSYSLNGEYERDVNSERFENENDGAEEERYEVSNKRINIRK